MPFDYSKLRGKIKEVYNTQADFATALGMSRGSLSQRLNNILDFTQTEMEQAARLLNFEKEDIPSYFFATKVQKHELNAS